MEWYDPPNEGAAVTVGGAVVEFADAGDGKTKTATVSEGTTATIVLLNPYEVPKEKGATDAPWTEDGEGNVTLNVEVVPGLYYAAASATSLDALKCPGSNSPATAETALVVQKPVSGTQDFFKVWVSDKAITAE